MSFIEKIFFFIFSFLLIFTVYKFYSYRQNLLAIENDDHYQKNKKNVIESKKEFYYFFIILIAVVIGIFFIAIYYLFFCEKEDVHFQKEDRIISNLDANKKNIDNSKNDESNSNVNEFFGFKRTTVNHNNNEIHNKKEVLNSVSFDEKTMKAVLNLKKGEMIVVNKNKIFVNNDGHLNYLNNKEINFYDKFFLSDNAKKQIKFFLDYEKEFMVSFLSLFLKMERYFRLGKQHQEGGNILISFFRTNNLREEENDLQLSISSFWKKAENALDRFSIVTKENTNIAINANELESFSHDISKDINFLINYKDGGFFQKNRRENRKKFKEMMKNFKDNTFYKIYDNHLKVTKKIISFLKLGKNIEISDDNVNLNFENEEDFKKEATDQEKKIFENVKKDIKLISIKLKE